MIESQQNLPTIYCTLSPLLMTIRTNTHSISHVTYLSQHPTSVPTRRPNMSTSNTASHIQHSLTPSPLPRPLPRTAPTCVPSASTSAIDILPSHLPRPPCTYRQRYDQTVQRLPPRHLARTRHKPDSPRRVPSLLGESL